LWFTGRPSKRVGRGWRQVIGGDRTGQPTASGTTSGPVPRDDAHVVGAPKLVSSRIRVGRPWQIVLAQVDKKWPLRSIGNDELQLASGHVVHAFISQSTQPVAMALLVSRLIYGSS